MSCHMRDGVREIPPISYLLPLISEECRMSATDGQREDHEDGIISIVRGSLVDDETNVRAAAARAFDALQQQMGAKAIDQTIPTLLEALRQPGKGSGTALQALKEVMSVSTSIDLDILANCDLGASLDGIPCVDTHVDGNSNDRLQCSRFGFSCDCSWQCFESTSKRYSHCFSPSFRREYRRRAFVRS